MRRREEKIKVSNIGREDRQIHPKPKPLQCIRPPIQRQTNIGPTLLSDLFSFQGSNLILGCGLRGHVTRDSHQILHMDKMY